MPIHDLCRVWERNRFRCLGISQFWSVFSEAAMLMKVWLRIFYFYFFCGLLFKLCLLQFWPLLSEELLLNDEMIHSANRNHTLTAPKFCQWTHRRFSLLFSALQSNLSVLDQMWWVFFLLFLLFCFLDDKNRFYWMKTPVGGRVRMMETSWYDHGHGRGPVLM